MAKLYFFYGAMGARKTAEAIMTAYNYEEKGMKPMCLSPAIDTRSDKGHWESRIGIKRKVNLVVNKDTDILKEIVHEQFDVVIVDEAQFLEDSHIWQLAEIVTKLNKAVICYGLRTDFKGDLFPGSYRLMCLAQEIHEIKTMSVNGKATMNARLVDGVMTVRGEQIQIGGNESYVSLSLEDWMKGKAEEDELYNPSIKDKNKEVNKTISKCSGKDNVKKDTCSTNKNDSNSCAVDSDIYLENRGLPY